MAVTTDDILYQPFDGNVKAAFGARLSMHNRAKAGPVYGGTPGAHARRLAAWCSIEGGPPEGRVGLSMTKGGFTQRYPNENRIPISSLTKITINRVTTTAEKVNLTIEILGEYETYTKAEFEQYAQIFLRRPEVSNPLTIRFGHVDPTDGRGIRDTKIEGAWVIGGGYTQEGNTWKCTFKAIAPANAIVQLDMSHTAGGIPKGLKFLAVAGLARNMSITVATLHEYILYCLQTNGSTLTENLPDGAEVFSPTFGSVGKVYKPFKGAPVSDASAIGPFLVPPDGAVAGVDTGANEYVSLSFIVKLVNKVVLEPVGRRDNLKFQIEFPDNPTSYIPGNLFRSGNPIDVLFLNGSTAGKYEAPDTGASKDFEVGGKGFAGCIKGERLDHRYILISRRKVIEPLINSISDYEREREAAIKSGRGTDLSSIKPRITALGDFFDNLFRAIATASGNYVNLTLTNPQKALREPSGMQILQIINMNMINQKPSEFQMLRPLAGDGSTLSCTFTGKLPDNLVALAIVSSSGHGSHTAAKAAEKSDSKDERLQREEARARLANTTTNAPIPGVYAKLAASEFAPADISAACSAISNYRDLCKPSAWNSKGGGWTEFFDTELNVEMEGAFPIVVGNRFSSDSLPRFLTTENDLSFVALDVTDVIEAPGVWTTSVRARLCHM